VLTKRRKFGFIIITILFEFIQEGCLHSSSDICRKEIVEANQEIDLAKIEIEQMGNLIKNGRQPSSLINFNSKWESWALSQLKRHQKYMDFSGYDGSGRKLRKRLSDIANSWVVFYGSCQQGNTEKMLEVLNQIRVSEIELQSSSCSLESK